VAVVRALSMLIAFNQLLHSSVFLGVYVPRDKQLECMGQIMLLCLQRLSPDVKARIVEGVRRGVRSSQIVKQIQDHILISVMQENNISDPQQALHMVQYGQASPQASRDYWVTVKDVQNVRAIIDSVEWKRDNDVLKSLLQWYYGDGEHVKLLMEFPEQTPGTTNGNPADPSEFNLGFSFTSSIKMARRWGNKRVIMMDSTHGTNNLGYPLTTVLVVDDHGNGHPVAWFFSSSESTASLIKFLNALLMKVNPHPSIYICVCFTVHIGH